MADPLSIIGGIAAIVQISTTVVTLIKSAKDASSDRQKVLAEINATTALCQTLNDYVEINGTESWAETLKILYQTENGPLLQFKQCLDYLHKKLNTRGATLKWPFNKQSVQEILISIERQKSLINLALANDNLRLSAAIHDELKGVVKSVEGLRISQDRDRRKNALSELTTIDFEANHADIASRRANLTGGWFLESAQFTSWCTHQSSSTLWCPGIPGSGKTTLSSLVVDRLRADIATNPSIGLAGIYCSYQNTQSTVNLMGSIIRQLLEPLDIDPPSTPLTLEKARAAMPEILTGYSKVILVVDALDECEGRVTLMKELQELMQNISTGSSKTLIHLFVTGRHSVSSDVERMLKPAFQLEIRSKDDDVRIFLQQILHEHGKLSQWVTESPEFGSSIIDAILRRLSGMFLLARLYMDLLCQIPTKRGVRKALEVLPDGIDKTYSEAWHRICTQSSQQAELGRRILSWLIHATRPLRVQELRYALAIEDNDEEIDPDGLLDVATLTSFCAGLVIVDEQRGLFSLVHPTTQEYFDKHKDVLFPAAHENIAATCITYLHMRPFRDEGALDDFDAFYERHCTCHLLGYAAVNWGFHAAVAGSEKAKSDSLSLVNSESVRAAAWQALQLNIVGAQEFGSEWPSNNRYANDGFDASWSYSVALHVAAYFGLTNVVQTFLELGNDVNQLDGTGRTPLHWAIMGKQNKILEFLLEHGANANAEIESDNQQLRRWDMESWVSLPLALTAFLDNRTAIECLLHHGAEINKKGKGAIFNTALSTALERQCRTTIQVLLEHGADVNVALEAMIEIGDYGDLEFLKMAVDAGANNYTLQLALEEAAAHAHYNTVVFLVERGANADGFGETLESCNGPDSLSPEGFQTPLVASAAHFPGIKDSESFQCFQYLVGAGANVNRVCFQRWRYSDDATRTPLAYHSSGITTPQRRKTTALHTAAYHGRLDILRSLVECGADVNISLGEQHTALSSALEGEGEYGMLSREFDLASSLRVRATISLLIDFGADPQLCRNEEIQRMETLLQLSSENCKTVAALQTVIKQLRNGSYSVDKSFRNGTKKLKELVAGGAILDICCDRDKKEIGRILALSEEEIDNRDEVFLLQLALLDEYKRRPI